MNCKTCNFSMADDQLVCPVCGTEVEVKQEQVVVNPIEANNVVNPTVETPTPVIETPTPEPVSTVGLELQGSVIQPQTVVEQTLEPVLEPVSTVEPELQEPVIQPQTVVEQTLEPVLEPVYTVEPELQGSVIQPQAVVEQTLETQNQDVGEAIPGVEPAPTSNIEITANNLQPEPIKEESVMESASMPVSEPMPTPMPDLAPSLESNQAGEELKLENPKQQKKGLGLLVTILITIAVLIGAGLAGYFGYKYFFNSPQEAPYQGYKYRIPGSYSAIMRDNKIIINENEDKSKSAWTITIDAYDGTIANFAELKAKEEELSNMLNGENTVNSVETKKIKNLEMLVFDVKNKNNLDSYIIYTLNKGNFSLKAELEFAKAKDVKVLEVLADIILSAKKS